MALCCVLVLGDGSGADGGARVVLRTVSFSFLHDRVSFDMFTL